MIKATDIAKTWVLIILSLVVLYVLEGLPMIGAISKGLK